MNKKNRIKELRQKENMTQEDLGKKIGVTGRAIGHYETQQREPSLRTAKKMADILGTTIEELFNL